MILPYLKGLMSFRNASVTWMIFILNLIIFLVSTGMGGGLESKLDTKLKDEYFLKNQGRIYAQFIDKNRFHYSPLLLTMSEKVLDGDVEKVQVLGGLAVRDPKFMLEGVKDEYEGDKVGEIEWKRDIASIKKLQAHHPSYILGVNADGLEVTQWFSYIFVHSGLFHFVGNMLFLLIFSSLLETVIGGLGVLILFLCSGAISAGVFLLMSGPSAAPLVGASGAISGIMAYFCFLYWNKPIRFVYWLFLPIKGYAGFIYLPGWVAFVLWTLSDLAGYFSSLSGFGGIAYTAHIGGEIVGLTAGILVSLIRGKYAGADVPHDAVAMGQPQPF